MEAIEYEIFVRSVQGAAGDHSSVSRYLRTGTDDRAQGQVSRWTKLHLTRDCTRYRSKYEVQYSSLFVTFEMAAVRSIHGLTKSKRKQAGDDRAEARCGAA